MQVEPIKVDPKTGYFEWPDRDTLIEAAKDYYANGRSMIDLAYDYGATREALAHKLEDIGVVYGHGSHMYELPSLRIIHAELTQNNLNLMQWCTSRELDSRAYNALLKRFNRQGMYLNKHSYLGKKATKKCFYTLDIDKDIGDKFRLLIQSQAKTTPTQYLRDLIKRMSETGEIL